MSDQLTDTIATTSDQSNLAEQHLCQCNGPAARSSTKGSRANPMVTLAVTTYNRPDYVAEALSSVLVQDYSNLEILVSDNGSRDGTPALVQALIKNDRRARFRRNDTTVPMHEHYTQCVPEARGEFFMLLGDDDRINSGFVSALVAVAKRHPDVNVVVPANATIDENGAVIEEFARPEGEVFDGAEFVCRWLYGYTPQVFKDPTTVLMRTDVLRRFCGYQDLGGGSNIDNLLLLQSAITGRVGFAKDAVFNCRVHNGSYGRNLTAKQVAEASRRFLRHIRCDPYTVKALAALPAMRRMQIYYGVRLMTTAELLVNIKFYENPLRWECFRTLFLYRWDVMFFFVVLPSCYRKLRRFFRSISKRTSET